MPADNLNVCLSSTNVYPDRFHSLWGVARLHPRRMTDSLMQDSGAIIERPNRPCQHKKRNNVTKASPLAAVESKYLCRVLIDFISQAKFTTTNRSSPQSSPKRPQRLHTRSAPFWRNSPLLTADATLYLTATGFSGRINRRGTAARLT